MVEGRRVLGAGVWVANRLVSSSLSFGHEVGVKGEGQELGRPSCRSTAVFRV